MDSILAGLIIVIIFLGVLASFYAVDRPRKPITVGVAFTSMVINMVVIYLLWKAYLV